MCGPALSLSQKFDLEFFVSPSNRIIVVLCLQIIVSKKGEQLEAMKVKPTNAFNIEVARSDSGT